MVLELSVRVKEQSFSMAFTNNLRSGDVPRKSYVLQMTISLYTIRRSVCFRLLVISFLYASTATGSIF